MSETPDTVTVTLGRADAEHVVADGIQPPCDQCREILGVFQAALDAPSVDLTATLAMFVRRLSVRVRLVRPNDSMPDAAMAFLVEHGLQGPSPRDDEPKLVQSAALSSEAGAPKDVKQEEPYLDAPLGGEMIALVRRLAQKQEPKLHSLADALERWAKTHPHRWRNNYLGDIGGLSETCNLCGAKQGWLE